jgi:hypothetical protein
MKTKLLLSFFILSISFLLCNSQVPQGFNYQAIARDGSGNPLTNQDILVKVSILSDTTGFYASGNGVYLWEEQHSVRTNGSGLFGLVIGTQARIRGVTSFNLIDWNNVPLFVGIKIQYSTQPWKNMGTAKLNSVPYAMVADSANGLAAGTKLSVKSANDSGTEALFEVKRKDGQTVFAVYPNAVNVYVPRSGAKGNKGGFAIGGYDGSKGSTTPQDYFRVTPDSVRIYIDPTPTPSKGSKGGFAIGGYGESKGGIDNMYFNLTGATSVNTVEESPQILWYPIKKAFLAGSIHIGHIDSVGQNSTALGYRSIAMGDFSQAFGYKAKAYGNYSTSIGRNSVAGSKSPVAENAFAFGYAAKATANDSYALGSGAQATGYRSFAFGSVGLNDAGNPTSDPTWAEGTYSVAIGMGAHSTGKGSMALGVGSLASGSSSSSFGYYSTSSGSYSSAIGRSALAQGASSVAVGYGAITETGALDASAFGRSAKATGVSSMAMGISANSVGDNSIAIGNTAVAYGTFSTSVGSNATTSALASYSTALGFGSSTIGQYSTALGYNAQANGNQSISVGAYYNCFYLRFVYDPILHRYIFKQYNITKNNIANGDYSVAFGNGNTSTNGGTTLGSNNTATGTGALAIGHSNYADSTYSVSIGSGNYSRGYNAFAIGEGVYAEAANSIVVGTNNITSSGYNRTDWVSTDPLFVIGNGGSGSQSNAMLVSKNGNTTIYGSLTVTGGISSYLGSGDHLGNHTATQNLRLNGYWLSNDGGNEGVYVGSTGLVGINDNTPSYTFDINGTSRVTSTFDANSDINLGGSLNAQTINGSNNSNLSVDAGTLHIDGTNNRVGINNISPAYGLDVTGTMNVTSSGRFGGDVTLSSISPAFYFSDTSTGEDDFKFEANADVLAVTTQGKTPVTVLAMASTGAVAMPGIGTGTGTQLVWNSTLGQILRYSSSTKYKTDVNALEDISWLFNLKPVDYLYKTDTEKQRQYGLIAEDVAEINNNLVLYNDGKPDAVNYNGLVAPLLKAVQDQKKIIDSLKADNDELKQRLEKLETIVSSMR